MESIKVKDLASLVLKAYVHFGVQDSRINRRWLVERDVYGATKAVAQSFHVFNGESVITMEQINQRGREIACENQGALYKAWCAIKEIMENDWLYEEQPFEPAQSIARTLIFEEYLMFSEQYRHIPRSQAAQEFKALERGLDRGRAELEAIDIYLMIDEAKDQFQGNTAIIEVLSQIGMLHFANPSCQPLTVDAEPVAVLEEAHKDDIVVECEPVKNIIVEDIEPIEETSVAMDSSKKKRRNGRGNLLDIEAELNKIYGQGEVELVSQYHGIGFDVTLRCTHCGKEWTRRGDETLIRPIPCPRCAARKAVENPTMDVGNLRFNDEYREEHLRAHIEKYADGEYTFNGISPNREPMKFTHTTCGTTFMLSPKRMKMTLANGSVPCPTCKEHELENTIDAIKEEVSMQTEHAEEATIGLFELQKYYIKAYTNTGNGRLTTGWKSMTGSMRAVMPEAYAYEKVSDKGRHVDLPVSIEDIEWITYYYADQAKTPTTDKALLARAIRNSEVWAEVLKMIKPKFVKEDTTEVVQMPVDKISDDGHIITIEEQEEAKRVERLQKLQQKSLKADLEKVLKDINNPGFTGAIESVLTMLNVAKTMRPLPDEVVAAVANAIGVKVGKVSDKEMDQLKSELEQLKVNNADLRATVAQLQEELEQANSWKESVRGLLASA